MYVVYDFKPLKYSFLLLLDYACSFEALFIKRRSRFLPAPAGYCTEE